VCVCVYVCMVVHVNDSAYLCVYMCVIVCICVYGRVCE